MAFEPKNGDILRAQNRKRNLLASADIPYPLD